MLKCYVFYKRVNRKFQGCEVCSNSHVKYKVVRVVDIVNRVGYVAGHNMGEEYFCSKECMKKYYEDCEAKFVRVKHNTITEINKKGYPA